MALSPVQPPSLAALLSILQLLHLRSHPSNHALTSFSVFPLCGVNAGTSISTRPLVTLVSHCSDGLVHTPTLINCAELLIKQLTISWVQTPAIDAAVECWRGLITQPFVILQEDSIVLVPVHISSLCLPGESLVTNNWQKQLERRSRENDSSPVASTRSLVFDKCTSSALIT